MATPRAVPQVPAPKRSRTQSSQSSSSVSSSACKSPAKTLAKLAISVDTVPVSYEDILPRASQVLGPALHRLATSLPDETFPRNIVPQSLKPKLSEYSWFQPSNVPEQTYYQDIRPLDDAKVELSAVQDIVTYSRILKMERGSEASWNDWVHSPVLHLALRGHSKVGYRNVTTASISPRELLAQLSGPGIQPLANNATRMVDYAMYVDLTESRRLRAFLADCNAESVNATAYEGLCTRPIAVSIETKKPETADTNKALTQLTVWMILHFKRLQQLIPNKQLPGVPMILVLGSYWDLYFYIPNGNNHPDIIGPINIGRTESYLQTYRLLASLRVVAEWAATAFDEWWSEALL
ncbi:hypothetical protein BKA80DRAFT_72062 [Phyllosticta citrichinensis]